MSDAPIAFLWLRRHAHDVDCTGSRIVALLYRPGVRGLCDVWALFTVAPGWRGHAAFACGFAMQLYWPQSMLMLALELLKHDYVDTNRAMLLRAGLQRMGCLSEAPPAARCPLRSSGSSRPFPVSNAPPSLPWLQRAGTAASRRS